MRKVFAVAISLMLITSESAFAHTSLVTSNPARGVTLSKLPSKISLTFEDPLLTLGKTAINHVVVTDSKGTVITSGIDIVEGAVLTDAFKSTQSLRGKYIVSYRVSAQDGHVVSGKYSFSVK